MSLAIEGQEWPNSVGLQFMSEEAAECLAAITTVPSETLFVL